VHRKRNPTALVGTDSGSTTYRSEPERSGRRV